MTKVDLDVFARRWQASGGLEEEAALLNERLRTGDLAWHRLDLAAFLGHRAAVVAWSSWRRGLLLRLWALSGRERRRGSAAKQLTHSAEKFAAGFEPYGREVAVRVALAVARRLVPGFERQYHKNLVARRALDAVETWVECPCLGPALEAVDTGRIAEAVAEGLSMSGWAHRRNPINGEHALCGYLLTPTHTDLAIDALEAVAAATHATLEHTTDPPHRFVARSVRAALRNEALSVTDVLEAVRAEVAPWALGLEPPESTH